MPTLLAKLRSLGRMDAGDVALWLVLQRQRCTAGLPHYRRYIDPKPGGGTLLAELPACAHPAPEVA